MRPQGRPLPPLPCPLHKVLVLAHTVAGATRRHTICEGVMGSAPPAIPGGNPICARRCIASSTHCWDRGVGVNMWKFKEGNHRKSCHLASNSSLTSMVMEGRPCPPGEGAVLGTPPTSRAAAGPPPWCTHSMRRRSARPLAAVSCHHVQSGWARSAEERRGELSPMCAHAPHSDVHTGQATQLDRRRGSIEPGAEEEAATWWEER